MSLVDNGVSAIVVNQLHLGELMKIMSMTVNIGTDREAAENREDAMRGRTVDHYIEGNDNLYDFGQAGNGGTEDADGFEQAGNDEDVLGIIGVEGEGTNGFEEGGDRADDFRNIGGLDGSDNIVADNVALNFTGSRPRRKKANWTNALKESFQTALARLGNMATGQKILDEMVNSGNIDLTIGQVRYRLRNHRKMIAQGSGMDNRRGMENTEGNVANFNESLNEDEEMENMAGNTGGGGTESENTGRNVTNFEVDEDGCNDNDNTAIENTEGDVQNFNESLNEDEVVTATENMEGWVGRAHQTISSFIETEGRLKDAQSRADSAQAAMAQAKYDIANATNALNNWRRDIGEFPKVEVTEVEQMHALFRMGYKGTITHASGLSPDILKEMKHIYQYCW